MSNIPFNRLAKVELHCHLDGSLSLETIKKLIEMAGISYPTEDEALKKLVTAPPETKSLTDYLKTFDIIRPLLQTKEALKLAAYDVAKQAALENVIYLELRYAPELSMDQGLTAFDTLEAVLDGLEQAHEEFGIEAKALVCGLKQSDPEVARTIFPQLVELANRGLAGFDFAGNEIDYPTETLAPLLKEVQALGLPLTFHAGECGCPRNITDGLSLGISRFGHATALARDEKAIEQFVSAGATIEMCLTSNLQTKAAATLDEFPYPQLYKAGAKITINTDNRTVSDTNLTKEYMLYNLHYGTDIRDFYRFNKNALSASFTDNHQKQRLLHKLDEQYRELAEA